MWRTDSLWLETAVVLGIFAVGNILFGHFEQHKSPVRRLAKVALVLGITLALSAKLGRAWGLGWLLLPLSAAAYVHLWWLPKHGINGRTGEPRDQYLALVGRQRVPATTDLELIALAHEWDRAMVRNEVDAIGFYMADDWTIVGSDGGVTDKVTFLGLIASGALSHDVMESEDIQVRVYGDAAVLVARGVSGGLYQGRAFRERELSSNVFVRQGGHWRCMFTHLSRLAPPERPE